MPDLLTLERLDDGAIAVLTLDRPAKRNALSTALRDEISDTLDALATDPALRALVITGSGEVFCAGFDLRELEASATDASLAERLWASSDRYHHAIASFPLPTIAAVNGPALAGGFDLAVLCDLRVVVSTAWFAHPERTFGEVVYGPLRELIGGSVARDLVLTGRSVDADEAQRIGLANHLVPRRELRDATLVLARTIAEAPREQLLRHKAKFLRFAGLDGSSPTLAL